MSIEKIEKVSVADAVMEQMKQLIINGEWKVGDKIAGENELVKMFGVSRVSVRDAIHRLIGMGILTVRHGDGTYVADPVSGQMQSVLMSRLLVSQPCLKDVLEFRLMVEVACAGLAAERASDEEIEELILLNKQMQTCDSIDEFTKLDVMYHNTIALLSGNSVMTRVMAVIKDINFMAMKETVLLRGVDIGRYNHTELTRVIAEHDRKQAEILMRKHIMEVINILPKQAE